MNDIRMSRRLNVLALTRYARNGASSRLRHHQWRAHLALYGIDCTFRPFFSETYIEWLFGESHLDPFSILWAYIRRTSLLMDARSFDLIWIEKECLPWLPALFELGLLRNKPTVIDFDDAWHLRYMNSKIPFAHRTLRRKLQTLIKEATIVVTGNEHLAQWARAEGAPTVHVIPTAIDLDHYPRRELSASEIQSRSTRIGWIGTPITVKYLVPLRQVLQDVLDRHSATFVIIGAPGDALSPLPVETLPWSEDTESTHLANLDIGIMPLPDKDWERAKSGYKIIQYMGSSIPVIASPVGVNSSIVLPGVTGLLASTSTEWKSALRQLINDADLRRSMGIAGRLLAEQQYSVQNWTPKLADILWTAVQNFAQAPTRSHTTSTACRSRSQERASRHKFRPSASSRD